MFKHILALLGLSQLLMTDGKAIVEVDEESMKLANEALVNAQAHEAELTAELERVAADNASLTAAIEAIKQDAQAKEEQLNKALARISTLEALPAEKPTKAPIQNDPAPSNDAEITITSPRKSLMENIAALKAEGLLR